MIEAKERVPEHTTEPEVERDEGGPSLVPERPFDVERVRADFPILHTMARGKPLIYLDNGATTQKPQAVIDRLVQYYSGENSNIHRGVHYLSEIATREYEEARLTVKSFLNAAHDREIIFTRGTTEAINLVASSYGRANIGEGDEIIISEMEHHAGIVPWQLLCEQQGAKLRVIPIDDRGDIIFDEYLKLLNERTKFVSIVYISNTLGTINPVKRVIEEAHRYNIPVMLDGAQAAPHMPLNVQSLDCDFFAFSGHKVYGPTGIGVLYGKEKYLDAMPPYQGGGDMIEQVSFEKTTWNALPYKFEAGTPDIAGAIGLGAAIRYVTELGIPALKAYEDQLLRYATDAVSQIEGLRIIGTAREKASILSMVHQDVHPHDLGAALDQQGIAVRTGHHCTQPLMRRFDIPGTARASFSFYNTREEVDALVRGIHKAVQLFA
jgi:cysteine desulfurase/selenocysteine lyase